MMNFVRDDAKCFPARGRARWLGALEECAPIMFHDMICGEVNLI